MACMAHGYRVALGHWLCGMHVLERSLVLVAGGMSFRGDVAVPPFSKGRPGGISLQLFSRRRWRLAMTKI